MPTFKNAKTITLPLFYDPKKPWYSALKNADAKGEPVILRAKLVGGDVLYWYGYLSYNGDPTMAATPRWAPPRPSPRWQTPSWSRAPDVPGQGAESFKSTLTIVGHGREQKLNLTYRHLSVADYASLLERLAMTR